MPPYGTTAQQDVPVDFDPFGMGEQYHSISAQPGQPYGVVRPGGYERPEPRPGTVAPIDQRGVASMEQKARSAAIARAAMEQRERTAGDEFIRSARTNPQFQNPRGQAALRYFEALHNFANDHADSIQNMRGEVSPEMREPPNNMGRFSGAQPRAKPPLEPGKTQVKGYIYMGGDPNNPNSWKQAQAMQRADEINRQYMDRYSRGYNEPMLDPKHPSRWIDPRTLSNAPTS